MKKLTLQQEGDWIAFSSSNATFINCVRSGITPASFRRYDSEARRWLVYYTKGPELVGLAQKFHQVDWGELPGAWQMLIVGGRSRNAPAPKVATVVNSPHEVLYLLDTAPPLVVKAVYKALLLEYHPDQNNGVGDKEKLNEVIVAYRKITDNKH